VGQKLLAFSMLLSFEYDDTATSLWVKFKAARAVVEVTRF
jgi:hypothetical protein